MKQEKALRFRERRTERKRQRATRNRNLTIRIARQTKLEVRS